jgi:TonB family protein
MFFACGHFISRTRKDIHVDGGNNNKDVAVKEMENLGNVVEITGGRSRVDIMRVVRQNMAHVQYQYNLRLKNNPGIQGRIRVRWAIDEFGKVISCKLVASTINDRTLEENVVEKIKMWDFGEIDVPEDVTEVEYTFVFMPN